MTTPDRPAPLTADQTVLDAVRQVVAYNWSDELADLNSEIGELTATGNGAQDHVFSALVALDNWLTGRNRTPHQLLEELNEQTTG